MARGRGRGRPPKPISQLSPKEAKNRCYQMLKKERALQEPSTGYTGAFLIVGICAYFFPYWSQLGDEE